MPLNDRVILFINGGYTEQKMEKTTSNLMSFLDEIIPPELINLSQEVEIDDVLPATHTYSNCGHQF